MDSLDLNALRIAEFIGLGSDIGIILSHYDGAALGYQASELAFKAGFKKVSDLYAREKGSPLSKEIEMADFRRDQCIIGIRGVAESYIRHFDPVFRSAADTLLRTIDKYGMGIAAQNYLAESESLRQLSTDLEADGPAKEALVTLGLTEWAAEMKLANTGFSAVYQQRNKETSEAPTGNLKELRQAAKQDYDSLMGMLDALNKVSPQANLTGLRAEINALIGKYNALLSSRKIYGGEDK